MPCDPSKRYVIGVEQIDYSPHYNFVTETTQNFFAEFVVWLNQKSACQFIIKALPIKRLQAEYLNTNKIDFIYPDNPNWHNGNSETVSMKREYSAPLITALGGTMVKLSHQHITLETFKKLAFPRGFTPVAWFPFVDKHHISFTETSNALSALMMVSTGRVDGADIEYNVAKYLINKHELETLVLANQLPFTPTKFHLSTIREPELLGHISSLITQHTSDLNAIKTSLNIIEALPGQSPTPVQPSNYESSSIQP